MKDIRQSFTLMTFCKESHRRIQTGHTIQLSVSPAISLRRRLTQDGKSQKRREENDSLVITEFFHLFLPTLYKVHNALMSRLHNRNICLVHRRIEQAAFLHLPRTRSLSS